MKAANCLWRRKNLVVDGGGDLFGEAMRVGLGKAGGKSLKGEDEGVGGDHALSLARNLFGDKSDGDQTIVHSGAENFLGLEESPGNLAEAGDVIFVVLDRIERHGNRKVREVSMDTTATTGRTEGHFELFEVVDFDALLKLAEEKVVEIWSCSGKPEGSMALIRARSARSRWCRVAWAASE
jgi:hypothetical protein